MPVKRSYVSIPVKIGDGGKLLPDLPCGTIGAANFDEKINFVSEIGEVRKIAGWDFPAPTDEWLGVLMELFGVPCEAIKGVRRPNGTYAIVGCGAGLIKAYHYDAGWVTIGSGYGTTGDAGFRWWQIEDIAGYAVFNNGLDLPCTWQIGDAAVLPLYEMREAGYASVGVIVEYVDGVLMCADVLEIDDDSQAIVMNSLSPYGTLPGTYTNFLLYSQQLDNAAWTLANVTITPNGETAPDGTVTADLLRETTTSGFHFISSPSAAIESGEMWCFSLYIAQDTTRNVGSLALVGAGGSGSGVAALFNLTTGEVNTSGTATEYGAELVFVGTFGGVSWFRMSIWGKIAGGSTSVFGRLFIAESWNTFDYAGNTSQGFALWGAQLVAGRLPLPYIATGATTTTLETTRISFRRIWSNIGNPRDFAVTVPGSITASTNDLVLAWPMASFEVGDTILVLGAGVAGGNLQTTITAISGVALTLLDDATTTVADADVARPTDIDSIAGYDDIEDDGSAIVIQITLKTQLITFKASGNIWQTYYTGDLDTPFAKDRVTKKAGVAPKFPRAVVNIVNDDNEEYLLFPGAKHFYRFDLGSQAPQQEKLFMGAEKELFFSRISGLGPYDVWAADNACTDEMLFAYVWDDYYAGYYGVYGSNRAVALKYAKGCESLSEISGFVFACAATVQKPLADFTCDENEMWFVMGAGDGTVTLYGETNLEVVTRLRYGEAFEASLGGGLFSAGPSDNGSYARRFSLDPSNPDASAATEVTIYGARSPNDTPVALETKTLTDPRFPGCMGLYYRKPFYKYRLTTDTDEDFRISGFIWRIGGADTQNIDRLQ